VTPSQEPAPRAPTPPPPFPVTPFVDCLKLPTADSEPLVLATPSDGRQSLIISFRDPIHPATLCTITNAFSVRFISRTEFGYTTTAGSNDPNFGYSLIARMKLTDPTPIPVAKVEHTVPAVGWSPDGSSAAYITYVGGNGNAPDTNQLWLMSGDAAPRALTPPITLHSRGLFRDDQVAVLFSPDGKYVVMADTPLDYGTPKLPDQAHFQVYSVLDGNQVWVPPSALIRPIAGLTFTTMAAWSRKAAHQLFYRDLAGVHTWDPPSTVGTVVAGMTWYTPSVSPDGRFVAYAIYEREQPHVEIRDLVSNKVQVIPGIRAAPFFVTDRFLLEAEYALGQSGTYFQTGRNFVFDLSSYAETPVAMNARPIDVWPPVPPPGGYPVASGARTT
jgi:hypothetical protein